MSDAQSSSLPVKYTGPSAGESAPDFWQKHLESWRKSGLTQSEYCRRQNLRYTTFRKWKEKLCNYYPTDSWDTKSNSNSIKLVEVKRDFIFDIQSSPSSFAPGSGSSTGNVGYSSPSTANPRTHTEINSRSSGIRFWCKEFCIEVDVDFSSECLSQLILTLQSLEGSAAVKNNANAGSV